MRTLKIFASMTLTLLSVATAARGNAFESTAAALTAEDVNAWLDGFFPYALHRDDIAGAEVAVVKDGQILALRGFGFADVAKGTPVDPKVTLFRPGSVSKLFTWTAVMQLVEQGKIDLDGDVNQYLDFKIPPRAGQPITMRNLMQHTAGFEEQGKGIISEDPKSPGFEAILKRWIPQRVFAPGTTPAYSNYGASLAGYIVQRVSGELIDDYLDQHIFAPLDMMHSTSRQPLPPNLAPLMSQGYGLGSGPSHAFEIVGPGPAGYLSSSAEDMTHFMIAHLQNGEYRGARILSAATSETMHNSPLNLLPPLNRMELGFFETNVNGREVIAHLGDTRYFHTTLNLFLKENVGLYASFNSSGSAGDSLFGLRVALLDGFADRYFPASPESDRVDEVTAASHAAMLSGHWMASRRAQTTFLAAAAFLGQTKIGIDAKGQIAWNFLEKPRHWVETTPFVWRDTLSHERLAAKLADGKIVRWSTDSTPFEVFERAPWYANGAWLIPSLCVSVTMLVIAVLAWPIVALVRRHYGATFALNPSELRAFRMSKIASIMLLVALALWAWTFTHMLADEKNLGTKYDSLLLFTQGAGFLGFVGGCGLMLLHMWTVWHGTSRWPAKLWSAVLTLCAFVLLWTAFVAGFLNFGVNY